MIYKITLTATAQQHLEYWRKSGQKKTLVKIATLLEELRTHPKTGTGQVEQLRGNLSGLWSRRIDKGNRLLYSINEDEIIVTVASMKGHY